MAEKTKIQWCDSTVNPIMGCVGCELFPSAGAVLEEVDKALRKLVPDDVGSKAFFEELLIGSYALMTKEQSLVFEDYQDLDTVHISHLAPDFLKDMESVYGKEVRDAADVALSQSISCYAGRDHNRKGIKVTKPDMKPGNNGFAPRFLSVTQYKGRMEKAAAWADLLGSKDDSKPWRNGLPRMIFVSDMGDALSREEDLPFLQTEVVPAFASPLGKRHMWLWLTKQPARMARLSGQLEGGFPPNVCAMTTVTSRKTLPRVDALRNVEAHIRGLSIEPLWERIPAGELDLSGIDWVIVGGESGSLGKVRKFEVEWAEELRDHCVREGVAFFLKQVGRHPSRNGVAFKLNDEGGGDWDEWDKTLRVREFPRAFYVYRHGDTPQPNVQIPAVKNKSTNPKDPQTKVAEAVTKKGAETEALELVAVTTEEKAEFARLNRIVKTGIKAFWEIGRALAVIKGKKLWRAGGHKNWNDYCLAVGGMSRIHAHRLLDATEFLEHLKTLPRGNLLPQMEAQVRPIIGLRDQDLQVKAWITAVDHAGGQQPSAPQVRKVVFEILHPEGIEEAPKPRNALRIDVSSRLRSAVQKRLPWEQLEQLLDELDTLL